MGFGKSLKKLVKKTGRALKPVAKVIGGVAGFMAGGGPAGAAAGAGLADWATGRMTGDEHGSESIKNALTSAAMAYGSAGLYNALAIPAAGNPADLLGFQNAGMIPTSTGTSGGGFNLGNILSTASKGVNFMPTGTSTGTSTGTAGSGGSWYTNPLVVNSLASLASGYMGADASKKAAKEQKAAADAAIANYWNQYYAAQEANAPWRDTGVNALGKLNTDFERFNRPFTMEDFKANVDPGYDFRLQEGMKARDRSAAARGELFSGAHQKEMEKFGQDFASNEYQNAWNRYVQRQGQEFGQLSNMAGLGQSAVNNMTQVGANTAANAGNALIAGGAATAAGKTGAAQAWSDALQNASRDYLYSQGRKQPNALFDDYMRKWMTQSKGA